MSSSDRLCLFLKAESAMRRLADRLKDVERDASAAHYCASQAARARDHILALLGGLIPLCADAVDHADGNGIPPKINGNESLGHSPPEAEEAD